MPQQIGRNWAGNRIYRAKHLHTPGSVAELQNLVLGSEKLKALGARHSFNSIADTAGDQISLAAFNDMQLDEVAARVRVGAGVRYGELASYLDAKGFALHNMASLPHISVVGACATGTHGSGTCNGNLSVAVESIELITGDGGIESPAPSAAALGLGALGVITALHLKLEPRFDVRQAVYLGLPFAALETHLEEIFSLGYSVSLFTGWQESTAQQLWVKRRNGEPPFEPELFGAPAAKEKLHPLPGHPAESCTEQLGQPGPWQERLPHFRMDFTPSSGEELQSEYFVPLELGYQAIRAVESLRNQIAPLLFISELRTIDADELWMSPCYRRRSMAIHFTWKPWWEQVRQVLPLIEAQLAPFEARPHWGKLFTMRPGSLYPRRDEFLELARAYDPTGKFWNDYLDDGLR